MQDLITSFIIQSKKCRLRGIGKFRVVTSAAEPDIANKQILPPTVEILFTAKEDTTSDELIKYVAARRKISTVEASAEVEQWCREAISRLKNGEEILLEPLGSLKKSSSGTAFFHHQGAFRLFEPVVAERVIHENSEHKMLVGDKETTSSVMNQFYNEEETIAKSNTWKIIAVILLVLALLFLIFHFYANPYSLSVLGNQVKTVPKSPPSTYSFQ